MGDSTGSIRPKGGSRPPERLQRATLLQALFSVPSERMLMEQIDHNCSAGLSGCRWTRPPPVWYPTVFIKNRDRLLEAGVARDFLAALIALPKMRRLLSDAQFTVACDVADFVGDLRRRRVTPHTAVNCARTKAGKTRKTTIDGRATRHPGHVVSQRIRKRVGQIFGWIKTQAGYGKVKVRGRHKAEAAFTFAAAANNLLRIPKLRATDAEPIRAQVS